MTTNPYESPTLVVTSGIANYRSLSPLATIVTALFLANAVGDLLLRWVIRPAFLHYGPHIIVSFGRDSHEPLFLAMLSISFANALLYLAGLILFFLFLYRAHGNARALGASQLKYSAGWTIASFFIPLVNLYVPYEAVRDIYRFSLADDRDERSPPRGTPIVSWWWTCTITWWGIVLIARMLLARIRFDYTFFLFGLAPFVYAISSVLAVIWIRQIASRQTQLYAKRAGVDAL